ncbi:MAG: DUF3822 family protein [Sphingobacteriaceae bacterium]
MGTVHLKEEKFDITQSGEMQLLIKVTAERISYAISNQKDNRLVVLYESSIKTTIENSISELLKENDYLRSSFAEVKVSVQTSRFTLIPALYYTSDNLNGYEKLVQVNEQTTTFVTNINQGSIKCVFALEQAVVNAILQEFPKASFFCQAEPLIESSLKTAANLNQLTLQFNDNSFEACYTSAGKFIFYNLYAITNADDLNYFLLMIMQQLTIDARNTSIVLAGNIVHNDENFKRIEKYFENIIFSDFAELVNYPTAFDQLPKHKHYSLLSLGLCE